MRSSTFPLLFIAVLAQAACSSAEPRRRTVSTDEWREDMTFLRERLVDTHPMPFRREPRSAFEARWKAIRDSLPDLGDRAIAVHLMRLVADLHDGHTNLEPSGRLGFDRWFPVRFYRFSDGVYVTAIDSTHAELAGARVLRMGRMRADSAADLTATLQGADNAFGAREEVFFLSSADALEQLGVIGDGARLPLRLVTRGGQRRDVVLGAVASRYELEWRFRGEMFGPPTGGLPLVTAFGGRRPMDYREGDPELPLHLRDRVQYWFVPLQHDSTVYFQFNFTHDAPDESFSDFYHRMFRYIDGHRVDRLIIDIRYNGGGNGDLLLPFVHELIKRDDTVNRPGHLFVIVGQKTFSAGVMLVGLLKRHTSASFVGEPAGAPLNHCGDPAVTELPNSGMRLSVSTLYWQYARWDDTSRVAPVQVPAPMSGSAYFAGRDPALEAILDGPPVPITEVLRTDGGAAARALYERRRRRFDRYPWWEPFSRSDMNRAGYAMLDAGRPADGVVAFELNTERYGDDWETWDSLGDGYAAAGRDGNAVAAFRKALALAPDNWNAAYEREMIAKLAP